jgi:hypothetical protein
MKKFRLIPFVLAFCSVSIATYGQHSHDNTELHISDRWKECSIQLDPSLTQSAWHQFTKEAGLVAYFRPLTDAKPMGAWKFEVSIVQWQTKFDDSDAAWNDTFVHPNSEHWLKESSRLPFPGLTARLGLTDKLDIGLYFTKSFGANYGFMGGQLQYNLLNNTEKKWSVATRANFTSLFGPEDVKLQVYGIDVITSKEFPLYFKWASIAPYAGMSSYLSSSRETTTKVDLHNENTVGVQAMVGAVLKLGAARLGVEYNASRLNTFSFKLGAAF